MPVLLQISALFILMAVGFAAGKLKMVDQAAVRGMSTLIVKATLPALIVISLQKPFSRNLLGDALETLLVATLFYAGMIVLSLVTTRLLGTPRKQAGVLAFSLVFSNAAFIGFPVVVSILGPDALFLTSIHNILFNVLAFSVGIFIVATGASFRTAGAGGSPAFPLKRLFNINVIAAIVGFAFFLGSVALPRFVYVPLDMLGGLTTPLAMIVTGAMLSRTNIASVLGDWRIYAATVLRLALWPLLTAVALHLAGVRGDLFRITVIIAGMPAASNTSLIAEVYGGDTDTASSLVFMTTLLSVVSIPVLALLLR